ncbi:hypothetical protein phytr_10380 [Candidatus Phycorickettsia trachydisci]|uniref:Uncharacterized protein n=1 Tax=Candidatus Phycorickettsia trachydisci TaxID=2115978 RepID=A0A2P1P9P0_9RICK|nr:hypothetical protein [Candidatus Phycorickettsia trachydisci]AVP87966.1 hypothetical protein phytr_10380 [Candidatus Phycorickettsia trachydisci]
MPNNHNPENQEQKIQEEIDDKTKKQIEALMKQIKDLFQSSKHLEAFKILVKISTGEIETDLTTDDIPLVQDKYGIKSIYHQLLDDKLITEANDFGSRCKTLGWDKSFHYEFLGSDET